jgi:hypothetical protein
MTKINKDLIKIRGRYYNKPDVELDTYTNEYELKSKMTPYVDIDQKIKWTSSPIKIDLGYININSCKSILKKYPHEIILHPNKKEIYCSINSSYISEISSKKYTPSEKIYTIDHYSKDIEKYIELKNDRLSFLSPYTLGFEFETSSGHINETVMNKLGCAVLYDGSITGPEYVTKPMTYKNLHYIDYLLKILKAFTLHDTKCSLHIHVGNITFSEDDTLAMYSLFQRLQEELNLLIAPYKKNYKFLASKDKDHCENLPSIPENSYSKILKLLGLSKVIDYYEYIINTSKWNVLGRYYTVNFMNYICKKYPNNTVEIRSLQMTTNFDYLFTWLVVNLSIINYAINNKSKIFDKKEKIELIDCISYFVKDSDIKYKIENNIRLIKDMIYEYKYIKKNDLTDLYYLDSQLTSILSKYDLWNNEIDPKDTLYNIYKSVDFSEFNEKFPGLKVESIKHKLEKARSGIRIYDTGLSSISYVDERGSSISIETPGLDNEVQFPGFPISVDILPIISEINRPLEDEEPLWLNSKSPLQYSNTDDTYNIHSQHLIDRELHLYLDRNRTSKNIYFRAIVEASENYKICFSSIYSNGFVPIFSYDNIPQLYRLNLSNFNIPILSMDGIYFSTDLPPISARTIDPGTTGGLSGGRLRHITRKIIDAHIRNIRIFETEDVMIGSDMIEITRISSILYKVRSVSENYTMLFIPPVRLINLINEGDIPEIENLIIDYGLNTSILYENLM